MARNEIQFQKGVSLIRFNNLYGTETQCYDRLFNAISVTKISRVVLSDSFEPLIYPSISD